MQKSLAMVRHAAPPVATGAIVLEGVEKHYPMFRTPLERLRGALGVGGGAVSQFAALKGVSFAISPGETVGILGVNGAGKSTLLGIIAGVIEPSRGQVHVGGRITALLELGAGFNPEWSGRQNAEFYGIMHGFTPAEARARIPDVEAFADIGEHFDQPMRTYSSGMFMRVAFAAAIRVDPDILIVDEALAVGDSRFQNKCFREFEKFKAAGKTIVVVTHSPELVVQHCTRAIVMSHGEVAIDGAPIDGFNYYLKLLYGKDVTAVATAGDAESPSAVTGKSRHSGGDPTATALGDTVLPPPADDLLPMRSGYNPHEYRYGNGKGRIFDATIEIDGGPGLIATSGATMRITLDAMFTAPVERPFYGFVIKTKENVRVYGTTDAMQARQATAIDAPTQLRVTITVPLTLPQGEYFLDLGLGETVDDEVVVIDARVSCAHFYVGPTPWCNGLTDLDARFEEIGRRPV